MTSFFTRLEARAARVNSLLCIGLDPHPTDLPKTGARAAGDFCLRLVEAASDVAAAFKPNAAFFESYGAPGVEILREVIAAVPPEIPVILDAKRGDIASTAQAYARAVFDAMGADAVTLNPYLGHDALEPFLTDPAKGVFLLCKTSNPGSSDIQDLRVQPAQVGGVSLTVAEHIALLARGWNRNNNLGLVVGATHTGDLARLRGLTPELWFLAPGVGAQGGDLQAALLAGLRADGMGLLLPVSRAISRAANPRQAALHLRDEINRFRSGLPSSPLESGFSEGRTAQPPPVVEPGLDLERLADGLLQTGCVKFGQFTLKSGLVSPIYIDLRQLVGHPQLLAQVGAAYIPILRRLVFDRLAALPYAAIPIATAISLQAGWPLIYPRKELKAYGTRAEIEGAFSPGERVVVIDDLTTTGGSKFEAIEKLTGAGLQVSDIVVLIDRQSGAAEALGRAGYGLQAVFTLGGLLDTWQRRGLVPLEHIQAAREFILSSGG